jgi:hypothetical protein
MIKSTKIVIRPDFSNVPTNTIADCYHLFLHLGIEFVIIFVIAGVLPGKISRRIKIQGGPVSTGPP